MVDTKITDLAAGVAVVGGTDVLVYVDISDVTMDASGTTKKLTPDTFVSQLAIVTLTATETLTNKTINAAILDGVFTTGVGLTFPTFITSGPINLGHATDTTLARVSAGVVSIEGVNIVTISAAETLTNKTIALGSNTVSGTMAELDAAVTDGDVAYAGGAFHDGFSDFVADEHLGSAAAATLTNKDLTASSNSISRSKSATVEDPADADLIHLFTTDRAITITEIHTAVLGGTSSVWTLYSGVAINSTTTSIETGTASSSTPAVDSAMSGTAAVAANRCVNLDIGAVTGSVTDFTITIFYTED